MILVTACFIVCWLPTQLYILATTFGGFALNLDIFQVLGIVSNVYFGVNPFIYVSQYPVLSSLTVACMCL